jgi:tetratricopeptide (TPR) repeat protein
MADGDWNEVYEEAEAEYFVGREQELESFLLNIRLTKPRSLIYYITGQGGVGKTTLLNRVKAIVQEYGFLLADCDEQQHDVPSVLGRFAQQLTEQGFPLKDFNERYKTYRQKMHEIENDPEAPQGIAATLARTVVRAAFIGGDSIPGIRKGLELVSREVVETQASEWATYLAKKFTNKDEMTLVRDPISILTPLFFKDVNDISQKRKVLLCFDNFEAASSELVVWILRLLEYKPSLSIRIAIAGRYPPGAKWDALRKITLTIRLDVFTEREAEAFLDAFGITDYDRRREILEYSGRLPVLMSWLSAPDSQEFDHTVPTHDIVERFLRWVPELRLRQVALLSAIPHTFNIDILRLLLNVSEDDTDIQPLFDWLLTMPFVLQCSNGWQYHTVVRRLMLHHQRQKSPSNYQHMHAILAEFYDNMRYEVSSSAENEWINEEWRAATLAYAYHVLAADHFQHWDEIISLLGVALRKRRFFAVEIIELLCSDDVHDELSHEQNEMVQLFKQQLEAIQSGNLKDSFEMFNKLCTMDRLSSQAKCYAFAYHGECYRQNNEWEKALNDFGKALNYFSEDSWIFGIRGLTYRQMKRYEEALVDLDRAIALDERYGWAIAQHGTIYYLMKRYEEALADLDRAIALGEKSAWVILSRALTYQGMKRYEEALVDLDRAIALDEKSAWAIASRGLIYQGMERYEEALADLDQAIALDEKSAYLHEESALLKASRGVIYGEMKRYEEALVDFDQAIALDEKSAWAIAQRGATYRLMKRYEEALVDFDRAIALDEKYTWAIASRGATYQGMKRYEEALVDFDQAIALDEKSAWAIAQRGATYRLMKRYEEALVDFDQAIALDEKYTWAIASRGATYQGMERYEEALADLDRAIALGEKSAWAIAQRGATYQGMERYEEALADLDRAIALDEKYTWAIASRGATYQGMERYEEALADLDRAIALDERNVWAITRRSDVQCDMGRFQEALEILQAEIQNWRSNEGFKSNVAWVLSSCADVLECLGRMEEALAANSEAIQLLPNTAPLFRNRAEKLIRARRLEEAEADLAYAVAIDGNENSAYLWLRRAELAIARGDGLLASYMLDEANNRNLPADTSLQRAQIAWLCSDFSNAQEVLQEGLKQASVGDRVVMCHQMEILLAEHPGLEGRDKLRNMLVEFVV